MKKAALSGRPCAGNPQERFDEGGVASEKSKCGSLLYNMFMKAFVAVLAIAPLVLNASVLTEAKYWMRAPCDKNADGMLGGSSAGELPETLHAAASSTSLNGGYSRGFSSGNGAANLIVKTDVLNPYLGIVEKGIPCLKMTANPTVVEGQTKYKPAEVVLSAGLPGGLKFRYDNSYSFYLRYYWNGFFWTGTSKSNWNMLLKLGLNQGAGGGGSGFGFGPKDNPQWLWLNFGGYAGALKVDEHGSNKWIQVVGVLNGSTKKLSLYVSTKQGSVTSYEVSYPSTTENVTKDYDGYVWLGNSTENTTPVTGDKVQHFNGTVADVAIWDKALTRDEAIEVFSRPGAYHWKIGEPDGTSLEFAGVSADQVVTNTDSWALLPNSIAAGGGAFKVAFPFDPCWPISATNAARSVAVVVKMANDSGSGVFVPKINGHLLKTAEYAPGETLVLIAPAEYVQNDNVLELAVDSGTAAKIDCVSGGLSWNIGFKNNSYSLDGFGSQGIGKVFALGSPTFGAFPRCIAGPKNASPGDAEIDLNLPAELVGKIRFDIVIRTSLNAATSVTNALALNGVDFRLVNHLSGRWYDYTIRTKSAQFQAGVNRFLWHRYNPDPDDAGYDPIDCVSISPREVETGIVIVVR